MDFQPVSLDDFDWSSSPAPAEEIPASVPSARPEETAPPPLAPATRRRGRPDYDPSATPGTDLLPEAYREVAPKNTFKRRPTQAFEQVSLDDFDWGDSPVTGAPTYNPDDHWSIGSGFDVGYEGMTSSVGATIDMAKIAAMPADQQVAAMLELARRPADPEAARLKVESFSDIGGVGDTWDYVMESIGQMAGSVAGAVVTGGLPGAAAGAAIGGAAGLGAGVVGAVPGAIGAGLTGAGWGTRAAFLASGVGGTFNDLLGDEAIQKALENGTVTPAQVMGLAATAGTAIGALDALSFDKAKGIFGGEGKDAVKTTLKRAVLGNAIKQAGTEGGTEALQGAISELSQAIQGGDWDTANRLLSVLNQGAVGAIGGAAAGGLGGGYANARVAAPPGQANPAPPAGAASPVAAPADGALDSVGGAGANGPGTGLGNRPTDPLGAGEADSGKREQGKVTPGTPVAQPTTTGVDLDLEATFEVEEDDELAAEATTPAAETTTGMDPDVAVAMGGTPAGAPSGRKRRPTPSVDPLGTPPNPVGQPAVATPEPPVAAEPAPAPVEPGYSIVSPWPKRARKPKPEVPLVETPADVIPEAEPLTPALETEVPAPAAPAVQLSPQLESLGRVARELDPYRESTPVVTPTPINQTGPSVLTAAEELGIREYPEARWGEPLSTRRQGPRGRYRPPEVITAKQRKTIAQKLKAAQAERVRRESSEQSRLASLERNKREVAKLETVDPSSLSEARDRLEALTDREHYEHFYKNLHPALQKRLPAGYDPANRFAPAPQRRAPEGFKGQRAKRPRPSAPRAPRAPAVALQPKPQAPAEKPRLKTHKTRMQMTLQHFRNIANSKGIEEAKKRLLGSTYKGRRVQAIETSKKVGDLDVQDIDNGRVVFKKIGKKPAETLSLKDFFARGVSTMVTAAKAEAPIPLRPKSQEELAAEAMAEHFAQSDSPVQLSSLGFGQAEISAMEARGVAEAGTMDKAEFGRWQGSRQGLAVPAKPASTKQHLPPATQVSADLIARLKAKAERWKREAPAAAAHVSERTLRQQLKDLETDIEAGVKRLVEETNEWFERLTSAAKGMNAEEYRDFLEKEAQKHYEEDKKSEQHSGNRMGAVKKQSGVPAADMEKQHPKTVWNHVKAVFNAHETKPDAKENPVAAIEWEMGELKAGIVALGRAQKTLAQRNTKQNLYDILAKKRIETQRKIDERQEKFVARTAGAALARENANRQRFQRLVDEAVAVGTLKAADAEDLRYAYNDTFQYEKRAERSLLSTKVLRTAIKKIPFPQPVNEEAAQLKVWDKSQRKYRPLADVAEADRGKIKEPKTAEAFRAIAKRRKVKVTQAEGFYGITEGTEDVDDPRVLRRVTMSKASRAFIKDLRQWGRDIIAHAEAELEKLGTALPSRAHRDNNTPEENAFIFLKGRLGLIRDRADQAAENKLQHGQTFMDAISVMNLIMMEQKGKEWQAMTPAEYGEWKRNIDDLYAGMFDQQERSGASPLEVEEIAVDPEQEEHVKTVSELIDAIEENTADTGMAEKLREAARKRIIHGSPHQRAGEAATGTGETISVSKAVDKYVGVSTDKGWRGAFRNMLVKSMKELIGDVPIEFLDDDGMEARGNARGLGGYYDTVEHKIYMHEWTHGKPDLRADIIVHEMLHAATSYALENNLRGTAQFIKDLRRRARQLVDRGDKYFDYYLDDDHEFLTGAMESEPFQDLLDGLGLNLESRADLRAHRMGRSKATLWDHVMAMFENAIGVFSPRGAPRSFMDSIVRFSPEMMMSSAEQQADQALNPSRKPKYNEPNALLNAPFNIAAINSTFRQVAESNVWKDSGIWLRKQYHGRMAPAENIRKTVSEEFFGGDYDNPVAQLIDAYMTHGRLVEDEKEEGDRLTGDLLRWVNDGDYTERMQALGDGMRILLESSLDRLDARKPGSQQTQLRNDALHPTKKPRKGPTLSHQLDVAKKVLADRLHEEWLKVDPELRERLSKRADHMTKQMAKFKRKLIANHVRMLTTKETNPVKLGKISFDDAVEQIYSGKVSDELEAALGEENLALLSGIGAWFTEDQLYMPTHRAGDYFISGTKDIAVPENATLDQEALTEREQFNLQFQSAADAGAYIEEQARKDDGERIIARGARFVDANGKKVPGKTPGAKKVFFLTLQHKFMTMGDSPAALEKQAEELRRDGYTISTPVSMQENRRADRSLMPGQLATMLKTIDNMGGFEPHEKALARSMMTNAFIKQQQGGTVTKRMLKRKAVEGYAEDTLEMLRSLSTNNEMMARSTISVDRMNTLNAALDDSQNYLDVVRTRGRNPAKLAKLPAKWHTQAVTDYAKDPFKATRLANDIDIITQRAKQAMEPGTGRWPFEQQQAAAQSMVVLSYLFKPVYFALQTMGLYMQTWPAMVGEMTKADGWSAPFVAKRYMNKAFADISGWKNYGKGLTETMEEGGQFAKGFMPRKGFFKHGRPMREQFDYIDDIKQKIQNGEGKYKDSKTTMLERARIRKHVGQAGLEQANIQIDMMGSGFMKKMYRGAEQSKRVFGGVQEGIEINNRVVPMLAYLEYYLDQGMDENTAIEKAINNMAREQVSYAKENWPGWMHHWFAQPFMMFKKFPMQQAINYYGAVKKTLDPNVSAPERVAALAHLGMMTAVLAAVGGFSGNPLWEPIRLLMYLLGMSSNWEVSKTKGEKWLADLMGPNFAESTMYGLPRLAGIDLSSRVAMDSLLFYQQPKEMTQEEWWKVIGQMAFGAPASTIAATVGAGYSLTSDESYPKWLAQLPFPGFVKDIFKSYDTFTNGPTTKTGVHTDKPPAALESIIQGLGVRTRSQARPFEQGSAAQQRLKETTSREKSALVQRVLNQGRTASNSARIKAWNQSQKDPKMRITVKDIAQARKRRRGQEKEMRGANAEAV